MLPKILYNADEVINELSSLAKSKNLVFGGYGKQTELYPNIIRNGDLTNREIELWKSNNKHFIRTVVKYTFSFIRFNIRLFCVESLYVIKKLRSIYNFSSNPGGEAAINSYIRNEVWFREIYASLVQVLLVEHYIRFCALKISFEICS